jgi:hypothetical protein
MKLIRSFTFLLALALLPGLALAQQSQEQKRTLKPRNGQTVQVIVTKTDAQGNTTQEFVEVGPDGIELDEGDVVSLPEGAPEVVFEITDPDVPDAPVVEVTLGNGAAVAMPVDLTVNPPTVPAPPVIAVPEPDGPIINDPVPDDLPDPNDDLQVGTQTIP